MLFMYLFILLSIIYLLKRFWTLP